MKNCICQIYKDNENIGIGYLCKIQYKNNNNYLPVLITSYNILNEKDIENNKIIEILIYEEKKYKNIENKNKIYKFKIKYYNY